MKPNYRTITLAEWTAEGIARFGEDRPDWKFQCPSCGVTTTVREWRVAGAPEGAVAFSCVGRYLDDQDAAGKAFSGGKKKVKQPCNYAGGGLFKLNPVTVTMPDGSEMQVFEFAPVPR
jgi:hypothetical protein